MNYLYYFHVDNCFLVSAGIEVNVKDYAGWTPLHEACNHGNIEAVTELLKYRPPKTIDSYFSKSML